MSEITARQLQGRAIYLHEAGHVIVGLACGYRIRNVKSDGAEGHTERFAPDNPASQVKELRKHLDESRISAKEHAQRAVAAYCDELTYTLGGIAGENVEPGYAAMTVRRGADDLASFFALVGILTPGFDIADRQPLWRDILASKLDRAMEIVRAGKNGLIAIADALEASHELDENALREILRKARI